MRPEDVQKLVGGYATGTLTEDERRALLEAALSDQDLFNELARDQTLKDLLEDPLARRRLLDALEEKKPFAAWLRRPVTWGFAGGLAAAAVLLVVFVRQPVVSPRPEPVLVAKVEAPPEPRPSEQAPPPRPRAPAPQKAARADKAKAEVAEVSTPPVVTFAAPENEPKALQAVEVRALSAGAVSAERGVARTMFRQAADLAAPPIPYRLLRASAEGSFTEVTPTTVFGADDRVRVVFEPAQSGRLRVVSASSRVLFDAEVVGSTATTVDVPAGEIRLSGTFRGAPFEISLQRQAAP